LPTAAEVACGDPARETAERDRLVAQIQAAQLELTKLGSSQAITAAGNLGAPPASEQSAEAPATVPEEQHKQALSELEQLKAENERLKAEAAAKAQSGQSEDDSGYGRKRR